jgi:hypothetical protein
MTWSRPNAEYRKLESNLYYFDASGKLIGDGGFGDFLLISIAAFLAVPALTRGRDALVHRRPRRKLAFLSMAMVPGASRTLNKKFADLTINLLVGRDR